MSADLARLAADLVEVVGAEGLLSDAEAVRPYDAAARYEPGRAALVVRPRSADEVSGVVGLCVRSGARFIPQGGNTGLVGGSTADASGEQVVLSLDRLQSPLAVDVDNRTVRAGAGVSLSAINAALEVHGLFLPIDLGADPTIGGMAATNTGGARYIRYGDMRRHVLGLEVVLADQEGSRLTLKGGVRKDNTGLDLRQLFIGAGGGLGVITQVEFEVHPRPRQAAAALVLLRDADSALPLLRHVEQQVGELLSAFEGMSQAAMQAALSHVASLRNPFRGPPPPYAVLIELSSARPPNPDEPLTGALEACLADWWERAEPEPLDVLVGAPQPMWALRHAISEGLRAKGRLVGFDLAFRRSDVAAFRRRAVARLAAEFPEFEVCDFGHIGDGGVHFNLVSDPRASLPSQRLAALRACVYGLAVSEFGGSFSGEHGLGRANLQTYRAFTPARIRELSGEIQRVFADAPPGAVDFG